MQEQARVRYTESRILQFAPCLFIDWKHPIPKSGMKTNEYFDSRSIAELRLSADKTSALYVYLTAHKDKFSLEMADTFILWGANLNAALVDTDYDISIRHVKSEIICGADEIFERVTRAVEYDTFLIDALHSKNIPLIELLLKWGADPNLRTTKWTPLDIVLWADKPNIKLLELLLKYGSKMKLNEPAYVRISMPSCPRCCEFIYACRS